MKKVPNVAFLLFIVLVAVNCEKEKKQECVPTAEVCNDGRDNDCDTLIDCGDTDCSAYPTCCVPVAEVCTNGRDDDCDTLADCADSDCSSQPVCSTCQPSGTYSIDYNEIGDCGIVGNLTFSGVSISVSGDTITVSIPEFGDYVGVLDEVSCDALFTEEIDIPETEEYYGYVGTGVITLTFTSSGFSGSETGTLDLTEAGVAVDSCSLNVLMTGTKM
jgi:hypothetical protein